MTEPEPEPERCLRCVDSSEGWRVCDPDGTLRGTFPSQIDAINYSKWLWDDADFIIRALVEALERMLKWCISRIYDESIPEAEMTDSFKIAVKQARAALALARAKGEQP